MKKIITLLIISLGFLFTSLFAEQSPVIQAMQDQLQAHNWNKEYLENSKDPDEWVLFVKNCGSQDIMIRLPDDPQAEYYLDEDYLMHFGAPKGENYHCLMVHHSEDSTSPEKLFQKAIQAIENSSYLEVEEFQKVQTEDGIGLDVILKGDDEIAYKIRVISTEKNVYTMMSSIKDAAHDQHQYFINSFTIVKPLPGQR